jgi:glycosyltransferase involved in cell wall biosynthesis
MQVRKLLHSAGVFICTRPDQIDGLAAIGSMPSIYQAVDDYAAYRRGWEEQEIELLKRVHHVCAVSSALAEKFIRVAGLGPEKISVLPNAIAAEWIPPQVPSLQLNRSRPLAGVLGRVSSRLRLDWLAEAIERTPWLDWLFAGDIEDAELEAADRPVLRQILKHPCCRFTGRQSQAQLAAHASTIDLAVIPYSERSVNPLASPARFFLHLAFGRPILVTPGCRQLEEFSPLVVQCTSPTVMVAQLERLKDCNFDDGLLSKRWEAAHQHTWDIRANSLIEIATRLIDR